MLISICTVCKNRAYHYKQTILKNIDDHKNEANVEFVLLDYNSEDDLELWVQNNLSEHIESGLFNYYKTFDPMYFERSHSRNMAFRLAKGDLICNVDADNYTGPLFSSYLIDQFKKNDKVFVCAGGQFDNIARSDIGGRICVNSKDFQAVGGYDEGMTSYGFEDFDLINRLEMRNLRKILIKDQQFLDIICHSTKDRVTEEFAFKNLQNFFLNFKNSFSTRIFFLFKNNTFAYGTLISERNTNSHDRSKRFTNTSNDLTHVAEGNWISGKIEINQSGGMELIPERNYSFKNITAKLEANKLILMEDDRKTEFVLITDPKLTHVAILQFSEIQNKLRMNENLHKKIINPNLEPIGQGVVFKNFDYTTPIILE